MCGLKVHGFLRTERKGRYATVVKDLAGVGEDLWPEHTEKVGGRQVQTTGMRLWKEGLLLN